MDDFAALFLGPEGDTSSKVVPYTFDDVIHDLNSVVHYDWRTFLVQRLLTHDNHVLLDGIQKAGYELVFTSEPSEYTNMSMLSEGLDARYSLGFLLGTDGTIKDVSYFSPGDEAGFAPGDQLVAVDGQGYSTAVLRNAMQTALRDKEPIELITRRKRQFTVRHIRYSGGEKYPHLQRITTTPDYFDEILSPRVRIRR